MLLWMVALACVCTGGFSHKATADEPSPGNYIKNGSFEQTDAQGQPLGWNLSGVEGLTFTLDKQVRHSGRQSLRITGKGVSLPQKAGAYPAGEIPLPADRVYNFEVWIKARDLEFGRRSPLDGGYQSHLSCFVGENFSGNPSLAIPEGTYDWTRYSWIDKWKGESLVPEPYRALVPTTIKPRVPDAFNGTLWIDTVSLREVEVVTTYMSVPTPELVGHYKDALKTPDGTLALLFAPPTKKVLRGMTPGNAALRGGSTGSISLARNEHEGIQIVMAALWDNDVTRKVEVLVAPLRNKLTGDVCSDIKVTWHPVGYMGMQQKNNRLTGMSPWPDMLLPAERFSVRGQELQPIWLSVHTGENAAPGDYETRVTVKPSGTSDALTAQVNVHVYDFAVPREFSLQTAFGAFFVPVIDMLFEHRLMPWHIGNGFAPQFHMVNPTENTFREFSQVTPYLQARIHELRENGGRAFLMDLPTFEGWYGGGPNSPGGHGDVNLVYNKEDAAYIVRYHREFAQWLREKGLLQDAYVYLWDEPSPVVYQNMRTIRELIREADPQIRCSMTGGLHEEIADIIDIWIPGTKEWNDSQALARKLVDSGDEMWWYITTGPDAPYANFQLDPIDDLLGARLMFWMAWKHRISGFLYWGVEDGWRGGRQATLNRIEDTTDCWWDKGMGPYMGGGCLAYPNPAERNVWSTMLFEAMSDGLSDHEYFTLLNEAVEDAKAGKPLPGPDDPVPETVKLLTEFTGKDTRIHMKYRHRLGRAVAGKKNLVLSTIRLEAIRDGLEDHAYFILLEKAIKQAKAGMPDAKRREAINRAEELLTIAPGIVASLTHWTHDDLPVRMHRDRVARAIEMLTGE